jgi:plasmid stabilization system protein ParE
MRQVRWTRRALRNLNAMHAFVADKNPDAAIRAAQTIRAGLKILETSPELGRPIVGFAPSVRERLIAFGGGVHVVRYRLINQNIIVAAIRQGRQARYEP